MFGQHDVVTCAKFIHPAKSTPCSCHRKWYDSESCAGGRGNARGAGRSGPHVSWHAAAPCAEDSAPAHWTSPPMTNLNQLSLNDVIKRHLSNPNVRY
ncbi:hypothetical protein EVAR_78953_1 [Eumeta japonica]|uniref:Uncharacterized protein n=1 Tax=Eumeta variegata TaxID=151549 RepID=A0A4C1USF9_EUMVA|nr:hypothetical protein EVAR_78953_1 [Eumeta japonica]